MQQCLHHLSLSFFPLLGTSEKCHTNPAVTTAEIVKIGAGQLKRDLCSLHGRVSASGPAQCDQAAQSHGVQPTQGQHNLMMSHVCLHLPSLLEQCLKLLEDCRILGPGYCTRDAIRNVIRNVNYVISLGPNKWSNVVKYMQPCHFSKRSRGTKGIRPVKV